jgi:hypothetical protein
MDFLGALFGANETKKIFRKDFNGALKQLPDISPEEREYLNQVFAGDLKDGLTVSELKRTIEKLHRNPNDDLDFYEVEHVKRKLLEKLGEK